MKGPPRPTPAGDAWRAPERAGKDSCTTASWWRVIRYQDGVVKRPFDALFCRLLGQMLSHASGKLSDRISGLFRDAGHGGPRMAGR